MSKYDTAMHEAAHAIGAHLLDIPIKYATILGECPHVRTLVPRMALDGDRIATERNLCLIDLAGAAVESDPETRIHDERRAFDRVRGMVAMSYGLAADEALSERQSEEAHHLFDDYRTQAMTLLAPHEQTARRIADALLQRGTLSGEDIKRLMRESEAVPAK